jgi:hypothetical protein
MTWIQKEILPSTNCQMDLEDRLPLCHWPLAYRILFQWDKSGDLIRMKPFSQESSAANHQNGS